jgi:cytochrome c oxidase cbb3-type subunit 3
MIKMKKKLLNMLMMTPLFFITIDSNAISNESSISDLNNINLNYILFGLAVLMLFINIVLGRTLTSAIKYYHEKKKKSNTTVYSVILFLISTLLFTNAAIAQDNASTFSNEETLTIVLSVVVGLLCVVTLVLFSLIKFFTGITAFVKAKKQNKNPFNWHSFWNRINRFKPIEEEGDLDTGHEYDGIKELDNVTPLWFIAGFALSILFAIGYMWRYHVSKSAPLQTEEYNISVVKAKEQLEAYLKTQANNVDESNVVLLQGNDLASGAALYANNCVACHGDKAQGAAVGPNLTDEYWLHKGSLKDIFKSIKYGWTENGMKSWKDDFSPNQIAQISSYIYSLKGSNPTGAKEPQGEFYTEPTAEAEEPLDNNSSAAIQ